LLFRTNPGGVEIVDRRSIVCTRRCSRLICARRRRCFPYNSINKISCPRVRDYNRGKNDDEQWTSRPETDHVVPVEVPSFRRQTTTEPGHASQCLAIPAARPPQVKTARDEEEKTNIACTGDRASDVAVIAFGAEPAMPVSHCAKEVADLLRAFAENRSGVRIHEQSRFTTERDLRGRGRI